MKLQYQMANGMWTDCKKETGDRTEEFLARCVENSQGLTQDEVVEKLESGIEMRNHPMDWYSVCRIEKALPPQPEMIICACGCTIPKIAVMTTSNGSSCPDCYDDMSN